MTVDPDTLRCLDDVKKGKPRNFVMLCKGVKIVSLIVYKKGTEEKYKKEAKKDGKGQFFAGVVAGKGTGAPGDGHRGRWQILSGMAGGQSCPLSS